MMPAQIADYVKQQEVAFETDKIQVGDNWWWNFRNHVQTIFHLKNNIFFTGANDFSRAFKGIMEPILNLAYWAEDIELKDVVFYIEDSAGRVLSFLIKKYHDEVYVRENNLDTLFDEITESDVDYGGVLVQDTDEPKPEMLELQSIAFCDQTDMLGAPIGFKHTFAPEKLRAMSKFGWGEEKNGATISIEDLIVLADESKTPQGMTGKNKTPGKQIEVYIVRGNLPEHYLKDNDEMEKSCYQLQIVALYTDRDSNRVGVTLYRKEEDPDRMLFHTSKKVYGRALGRGVGESLLHPQVWTNFLEIHKMNMLAAGSKVLPWTDDEAFTQRNKIQNKENLEWSVFEKGAQVGLIPTVSPLAVQMLDKAINEFYEQGQLAGAAFDPMMGKEAVSGTTFRGQNQVVQQGRGLHDRRRGQRAKFIEEIYRKMILPKMKRAILKGRKFLATLNAEEMEWVSEQLAINQTNQMVKDKILNGDLITQEEIDAYKQVAQEMFKKKGNKHLIEILKGEMEGIELKVGINVAGKQKNLAGVSDKLLSIFQSAFANPVAFQQTMQIPSMAKAFENILEYSGINSMDFSALITAPALQQPMQPQQMAQQQAQPMLPSPQPA